MLVRVFDSQRNTYFKSEVYAVINSGWYEKQLVVFSSADGSYFKLFDYLDKSNPNAPKVLINLILPNGFNSAFEWMHQRSRRFMAGRQTEKMVLRITYCISLGHHNICY